MTEFGPDELHLRGKLQVETARNALDSVDMNPAASLALSALLNAHSQLHEEGEQEDLVFYIQGGDTATIKSDVVTALGKTIQTGGEAAVAASELLDVLTT